jgi:uncharacterized protein YndB with AHSA1/START domain
VIEVERRVRIARTPDRVFEHLSRPEGYPVWLPGVRRVTVDAPGPVEVGTPVSLEFDGPTGRILAEGRITGLEVDRRVALEAAAEPLRFQARIDLEAVDGLDPEAAFAPASDLEPGDGAPSAGETATELTLAVQLELLGGLRFLEGLARAQAIGEVGKALERLRLEIEA